jgi:Peptidase family S41/Tricorn protease C1 domain
MKKIISIVGLLLTSTSCNDLLLGNDPSNNPVNTFEEFWKGVELTWPAFETKRVNWDSLYSVYRPQITPTTSNVNLIKILNSMVIALKDSHTNVFPKNYPAFPPYPRYPTYFYGINWVRNNYLMTAKGNNAIAYGLINSKIGYIYIGTFANPSSQYEIIDAILNEFGNVNGIIIDVRNNSGGNFANSETIASRFVDKNRVYAFGKSRKGRQRNTLTDFFSFEISPAKTNRFTKKVAVLSNRYSFSATEEFLLMMKSLPQVTTLGDYTGGGSESLPVMKELPNGWTYRVSSRLEYDATKQLISNGIAPDFLIKTTKADSINRKDSIIEGAILELSK